MAAPHLLSQAVMAENILHEQGFAHLHVRAYGQHLVIDTQEDDERWNRARLTSLQSGQYQLGMTDRRGKWEPTPFTGTLSELLTMLVHDFAFVLTPA